MDIKEKMIARNPSQKMNCLTSKDKPLISIVFHSGSGHTEQMSHAVAKGALADGNVDVIEHQIFETDFSGGRWQNDHLLEQLDHPMLSFSGHRLTWAAFPRNLNL
ncbi:MAG: hypothetical protein WBB23_22625 [Desulforhopalus sp.]